MDGMVCIAVEIAAVGPAVRVKWRDIEAWRRVWASWTMAKVPQTVTSEVWGVPWARMLYPEGPWGAWDGFAWYLMRWEATVWVNGGVLFPSSVLLRTLRAPILGRKRGSRVI